MAFKRSRKPLNRGKRKQRCLRWWAYRAKRKQADVFVFKNPDPARAKSATIVDFNRIMDAKA